jgi:hypothetical protein
LDGRQQELLVVDVGQDIKDAASRLKPIHRGRSLPRVVSRRLVREEASCTARRRAAMYVAPHRV